jgi:hypothetical protein
LVRRTLFRRLAHAIGDQDIDQAAVPHAVMARDTAKRRTQDGRTICCNAQ